MARLLVVLLALMLAGSSALPSGVQARGSDLTREQRRTLERYAADTWQSFVMLADPATGLPSDNVTADGTRSRYTSPTNIGTYLWSTIAARDLRIIGRQEARDRMAQTLASVATLERHAPSGQFYNWYDPATGQKLTVWPVDGSTVYPFLSSVDNGWLAAALIMVANAEPRLRDQARSIVDGMNFGFYYDPNVGQIRGGYWPETPINGVSVPTVDSTACTPRGASDPAFAGFTCHFYGALNTEPRIASYIGIAMGDIPPEHYFRMFRTFPAGCDWGWQEQQPAGETRTYLGVEVFEGHYTYNGMRIVPSWGGSMFEALMVPLLVPEEQWGARSWGINHPLYVRAQIEHGLNEAGYGYWGFSPANKPEGGYSEYGVDAIGLNPDGYASNNDRTLVDYGFGDCRPAQPLPPASAYTNGVVTPHASFLALDYEPQAALENLANLRRDFDIYGSGGFYDSVNVDTGVVSQAYLALDQGMIMAAIANELTNDRLQQYFTRGAIERTVKPILQMEQFTAGE